MKTAEAFIKTAVVATLAVTFVVSLAIWLRNPAPAPMATTGGGTPAAVATTGTVDPKAAATAVVNDWMTAIRNRDVARINEVLADEFTATLPDGGTTNKWLHIKDLQTRRYVVDSLAIDHVAVRIFGNTAIVTYEQDERSRTGRDDPYVGRTAWTDVLINRDGRWQIVAEHGSQMPSWDD